MSPMASQITSLTILYSTIYSDTDQRKHQSSVTLAFMRGINRWPVNSPHKGSVTRKICPFDDVIMLKKGLYGLGPNELDKEFPTIFGHATIRINNDLGFNSLGPSDAIWRWRSWSTLVQVMACCLTAPSHYLNQCWLIISEVQWHS